MARTDPQLNLRLPQELKDRIETTANEKRRSVTAEVIERLTRSFDDPLPGLLELVEQQLSLEKRAVSLANKEIRLYRQILGVAAGTINAAIIEGRNSKFSASTIKWLTEDAQYFQRVASGKDKEIFEKLGEGEIMRFGILLRPENQFKFFEGIDASNYSINEIDGDRVAIFTNDPELFIMWREQPEVLDISVSALRDNGFPTMVNSAAPKSWHMSLQKDAF